MNEYEADIAAWAVAQAEALRNRSANTLDWDNLAEEIEEVAGSQRREVRSRLGRICEHLLKLRYQPRIDPPTSWQHTIIEQRQQLESIFEDSKSLRTYAATQLEKAYKDGFDRAVLYTPSLPSKCPWSFEEVCDHNFWPESAE